MENMIYTGTWWQFKFAERNNRTAVQWLLNVSLTIIEYSVKTIVHNYYLWT